MLCKVVLHTYIKNILVIPKYLIKINSWKMFKLKKLTFLVSKVAINITSRLLLDFIIISLFWILITTFIAFSMKKYKVDR